MKQMQAVPAQRDSITVSRTHDSWCHEPRLDGEPSGPNCRCPYPYAKGGRDYFSADVVRPVHIAVDQAVPAGTIPAPVPLPAEARVLLPRWIVGRQGIPIQEARLAGGERDQAKGRPCEVSLAPQTPDHDPKSVGALGKASSRLETLRRIKAVNRSLKLVGWTHFAAR